MSKVTRVKEEDTNITACVLTCDFRCVCRDNCESQIKVISMRSDRNKKKKVDVNRRADWNDDIFSFAQRHCISSTLSRHYFSPGLFCQPWRKQHRLWNIEAIHQIKTWVLSSIKCILISLCHSKHLYSGRPVITFYRPQLRRSWASAVSEEGRLQLLPINSNQQMWFVQKQLFFLRLCSLYFWSTYSTCILNVTSEGKVKAGGGTEPKTHSDNIKPLLYLVCVGPLFPRTSHSPKIFKEVNW